MTDIAEEMRGLANEPIVTGPERRALLRKGANEIERLRAALTSILDAANCPYEVARAALSPSERTAAENTGGGQ